MIDAHPTSSNGRMHGSPPRRQGRDRRYALIAGTAFVLGFGVLALAAGWATLRYSPAASDSESRTGSIMVTTSGQCRQAFFDNDSGQLSDAGNSCKGDAPLNSIAPSMTPFRERRIDAISKSFSNSK
jgi:hypothetical protein